jgi:hypothetical protein
MAKRKDDSRKALDLWTAPAKAGEPELCVATTFTFDAAFFERDCLGRFLAMEFDAAEGDSVAYLVEREEKLAASRACVLVDRRHARDKQSLRWDVIPVIVPRAVQHAKLSLLVWAHHVRAIIGSGNLTTYGYRSNLEVFGSLDLTEHDGGSRTEILGCFDFLGEVVDLAVGDPTAGPIDRARKGLAAARRRVAGWPETKHQVRCGVVFGGPKRSVIEVVKQSWPSASPARTAWVASPFFDAPPNDHLAPDALLGVLAKRGARDLSFAVPTESLPDGRLRVRAARGIVSGARSAEVELLPIPTEQQGENRTYHAKLLHLANDDWQAVVLGSSNFTAAGLGVRGYGNLEANLMYMSRAGSSEARAIDAIWPETGAAIDLESAEIVWEPCDEDQALGLGEPCLPGAFCEALFVAEAPLLRVVLTKGLPKEWRISVPGGETLLSSSATQEGKHEIAWTGKPTPFVLEVTWEDLDRRWTTSWAVNVSDPAALPPPEELRSLRLDDLLEVLASTRPIAHAVSTIIARRSRVASLRAELDPHKRVNTHAFLLQRTKRVAAALDRLRERLERPVLTYEALDWRLRGAVGPVALAAAVVREHRPAEARFFLAEIILALHRVDVRKTAIGGLARTTVNSAIRDVTREIERLLPELGPAEQSTGLDAYVTAALAEARS